MKVILKQDVKGLGRKMTWLMSATVMPGIFYFKGLAVEANQGNLNIMKTRKEAEKSKRTARWHMQESLPKSSGTLRSLSGQKRRKRSFRIDNKQGYFGQAERRFQAGY